MHQPNAGINPNANTGLVQSFRCGLMRFLPRCFQSCHKHNPRSIDDMFYSLFYLGLFCESRGETGKAENYMRNAAKSDYATRFGTRDYMTAVARVHCQQRGWRL